MDPYAALSSRFLHDRRLLENGDGTRVVIFLWLLVEGVALEPSKWQELNAKPNQELKGSNSDAEQVLVDVEWPTLEGWTSKLDHSELHEDGEDSDVDEERVSEHASEDVQFSFKFSCVELVEDLHHNEGLEDVREQNQFLGTSTKLLVYGKHKLIINIFFGFVPIYLYH